jgi:hypothetical protein
MRMAEVKYCGIWQVKQRGHAIGAHAAAPEQIVRNKLCGG